jgi:hemoglobin
MRHAPFAIGPTEREAWYRHMSVAVASMAAAGELSDDDEARMLAYFRHAAGHMVNTPG